MAIQTAKQEVATIVGYLAFAGMLLLGGSLEPGKVGAFGSNILLAILFVLMLWLAFSVVRHAEALATLLGEPYGTLILTLSVIGIEVALISSVMIAGGDKSALARDTMFSVVMIVLNGLVGLSLLIGGLRHRLQEYNLIGASAYLAVLIPLAVLSLILPRFTPSAPGGELSLIQSIFLIMMSIGLYGIFLAIQVVTHSDIFMQPTSGEDGSGADSHHHHEFVIRSVPFHSVALIAAMLPIVLLSKALAIYINFGISQLGVPLALGGFLIAALVLTPEGISAVQAARDDQLQ
ncbi:MAG: calcium:proton antiporter, partial [Rhizobiaceae bacterium]